MSRRWLIGGVVFFVLAALCLLITGINMRYRHLLANGTFVSVSAVIAGEEAGPASRPIRADDWTGRPDPTSAIEAVAGLLWSAAAGFAAGAFFGGEEGEAERWGPAARVPSAMSREKPLSPIRPSDPAPGSAWSWLTGDAIGAGLVLLVLVAVAALAWSQSPTGPQQLTTLAARIGQPGARGQRPAPSASPEEQAVFAAIVGALGALACYVVLTLGGPRPVWHPSGQDEEASEEPGVACPEPDTLPMPR